MTKGQKLTYIKTDFCTLLLLRYSITYVLRNTCLVNLVLILLEDNIIHLVNVCMFQS